MTHYFAKVSARVRCGWCEERILVTADAEIDCDENGLEDLGWDAQSAISDQMESDSWGWNGKYCPSCMAAHKKKIHDQEHADDFEEDAPTFEYADMIESLAAKQP